jgi:signal transduction histidine kinase
MGCPRAAGWQWFRPMANLVRLITLSLVLLLLFLAAALGAQSWLQKQHARLQTEAVAAKQRQLDSALELTATLPDQFSSEHLQAIGRLIDAHLELVDDSSRRAQTGFIGFTKTVTGATAGRYLLVQFETPQLARLSLLHGRTWVFLLIAALSLMLAFGSAGLLLARRQGSADTGTPWSAAKADMNSLAQLARTSIAQDSALAHERSNRRRIEKDLSMHQQLQNQALEEKIRLGRDLHDGVIQSLYAVGLTIEAVRPMLARDPAKAEQRLKDCLESLNRTIRKVREYITGLSPESLRRMSFAETVRLFLDELRATRNVQLDMIVDEDAAVALTPGQTTEALQVTHEAISNALRHGQAATITVRLHKGENEIGLLVRDDGIGFERDKLASEGHGLDNMQARAAGAGATLRIDSLPGCGTRIVMTFPVTTIV